MANNIPPSDLIKPVRRLGFKTAILILVAVSIVTVVAINYSATSGALQAHRLGTPDPQPTDSAAAKPEPQIFQNWPANRKPDLALILSAQMHGYIQPCGCSEPQFGGLQRRYNFMQSLKARGWPIASVDLGDIIDLSEHRTPQTLLKYETSMLALDKMGYIGIGLGLQETKTPLIEALGQYTLNHPTPKIVASNLDDKGGNFTGLIDSWVVGGDSKTPKVGVVCIVGPEQRKKVPQQRPEVAFKETMKALPPVLQAMQAQKPEVLVLLYQGTMDEARACGNAFPQFQVVLYNSAESEPPAKPERIKDRETPLVISVGHKGRYVGVVGFYRNEKNPARPFDLHYQLVMLGKEYETKTENEAGHPVLELLEAYTKQLKATNMLAQFPKTKHPVQLQYPKAEYVGSAECAKCHRQATQVWAGHPHSHAFQVLVNAKRPSLRNFDGECVVCHTIGFSNQTGFVNEQMTPKLLDVGCESCHGPGSLHADLGKKTRKDMLALMNPFRVVAGETPQQEAKRMSLIDQSCQKCHDIDNDVHWDFAKKWLKVVHHNAPKE